MRVCDKCQKKDRVVTYELFLMRTDRLSGKPTLQQDLCLSCGGELMSQLRSVGAGVIMGKVGDEADFHLEGDEKGIL